MKDECMETQNLHEHAKRLSPAPVGKLNPKCGVEREQADLEERVGRS